MRVVCDKCGREIEVTEQEARHLEGILVCPQCLGTVKVDVSRIPPRVPKLRLRQCPNCGEQLPPGVNYCNRCGEAITAAAKAASIAQPAPPKLTSAPPPYRPQPQPQPQPRATTAPKPKISSTNNKPTTKKMSNNRNNNRKANAANNKPSWWLSPLGCLTATVIFVLLFFLIYYLLGSNVI